MLRNPVRAGRSAVVAGVEVQLLGCEQPKRALLANSEFVPRRDIDRSSGHCLVRVTVCVHCIFDDISS